MSRARPNRRAAIAFAPPAALLGLGLLLLVVAACGGPIADDSDSALQREPLLPALSAGAFVPAVRLADFAAKPPDDAAAQRGEADVDAFPYWLPQPAQLDDGWGFHDHTGRWAVGARATLTIAAPADDARELVLVYYLPPTGDEAGANGVVTSRTLRIEAEGRDAGTATLRADVDTVRVTLPPPPADAPRVDGTGEILRRLTLHHDVDYEAPLGSFTHALALRQLALVAPGAALPPTWSASAPAAKVDDERNALYLLGDGTYIAPLRLPDDPDASLRATLRGDRDAQLSVALLDLAEGRHRPLGAVTVQDDGSLRLRLADAGLPAGSDALLLLRASGLADDARLALQDPHIARPSATGDPVAPADDAAVADAATPSADAEPADGGAAGGDARPNLALIVLDAARADSFGAYGYERDTSPFIDALVDERGLVVRWAYSECASTFCSMPHMFTGMPMLPIGRVFEARRLSDDVISFVEQLRDAGYRTVGISGNPNHAVARNTHQGFEIFHEMWLGFAPADRARRDPFRLSARAIEEIQAASDDPRPLFLMLHYVPPHEPYEPKPAYDLFTDPNYEGPVEWGQLMKPFRDGQMTLEADDVVQLKALYDGNLRMGDAATAEVLDALRAADRFEDAGILITADHGEAFLEHGEQGHNTTVYDEMIEVPFILRLPPGVDVDRLQAERHVSLADVGPTFLTLAGLTPPPANEGVDLLDPARRPAAHQPRMLFHRTQGAARPSFAAHTARWKAIVRPALRQQALYDKTGDPGELTNVMLTQPHLFAGLALALDAHRAEAASRGDDVAADVPLSQEDIDALRALGYTQ
ncbi:MAG: sulfatase [Acidobacteriota bacterium]